MKTEKNILIAFLLNLIFSIVEVVGGILTGSIAIVSDAVHDFGDAFSICVSYFFEKKSKKQPDGVYTYGYARYAVLGGLITTVILLFGSAVVIYNAVFRFFNPIPIDYDNMLMLAVVGLVVNLLATYVTHGGRSINQKAVNLHMLEDVLGWIVILIGAVIMRFTNFYLLDPILSILVAVFILVNAVKNLKEILDIFLLKKPKDVDVDELKEHVLGIEGVTDVHHIHIWTIEGERTYATMHIVAEEYDCRIKKQIKEEMAEHGIAHTTIEMETPKEECEEKACIVKDAENHTGHHHHHHHHH